MQTSKLYQLFLASKGISIDSRAIEKDQIFFAIKGERFDGNKYARQAIDGGAKWAIVDDAQLEGASPRIIRVPDSLKTLQALAHFHRQQFTGPVIAITGSNGKTTSKELTQAILQKKWNTYATKGNLNNHIGTPLTLLSMPVDLDVAVIEFGDNMPGEIAVLSEIALPDYGVVTNVGKDHLEGFGNWQGVYKARMELFDHLRKYDKPAFVNLDIDYLPKMAQGLSEIITYGTASKSQYRYKMLGSNPFVEMEMIVEGKAMRIQSHLFGEYNFQNLMLAATIGQYFEVASERVGEAIENYKPDNNRSQVIDWKGSHVLLDAYNANPSNVEAALDSFAQMKADHKMVILGDMLELGDHAQVEHERMAEKAKAQGFDKVILVGAHFKPVAATKGLLHFDDVEELKEWCATNWPEGYWVLIKGSRKISLEELLT